MRLRDATAVGADLTLAQQDETLDDLAFFLDEFGSTRAVRAKLQEQEGDIKRFKAQVQRLVNDGSSAFRKSEDMGKYETHQENTTKGSEQALEDADETMAHLDFFLTAYGSTRAVRETLVRQKREIAGLEGTIQWLQERRSRASRRECSRGMDMEYVDTAPASRLKLETRGEKQGGDASSMSDTDCTGGGDGNEEAGILDGATEIRIRRMKSCQRQLLSRYNMYVPKSATTEYASARRWDAGPKE